MTVASFIKTVAVVIRFNESVCIKCPAQEWDCCVDVVSLVRALMNLYTDAFYCNNLVFRNEKMSNLAPHLWQRLWVGHIHFSMYGGTQTLFLLSESYLFICFCYLTEPIDIYCFVSE